MKPESTGGIKEICAHMHIIFATAKHVDGATGVEPASNGWGLCGPTGTWLAHVEGVTGEEVAARARRKAAQ